MHVDSHRLRFYPEDTRRSAPSMPCSKRFAAALQETTTSEDGVKMYTWRAVRRQQLRKLRKQTRSIVFFMALMEVLRVGAADIVYGGKHGTHERGAEDYGIAYSVGYFISWLYMCLFAIVFVTFFSWWIPASNGKKEEGADPSTSDRILAVLDKANLILIPTCIGLGLMQHVYHTICTFIHVDARPVEPTDKSSRKLNTRKNWGVRALLFAGVCTSMAIGKVSFYILEHTDLAHVKPLEYCIIVLPIQVNLGILLGSAVQFKAEQRQIKKLAAKIDTEAGSPNEKQALLVEA